MYVNVCECVCTCVSVHECVFHTRTMNTPCHARTHAHPRMHLHMQTHTRTHTRMHMYTRAHACTHMRTHTHAHERSSTLTPAPRTCPPDHTRAGRRARWNLARSLAARGAHEQPTRPRTFLPPLSAQPREAEKQDDEDERDGNDDERLQRTQRPAGTELLRTQRGQARGAVCVAGAHHHPESRGTRWARLAHARGSARRGYTHDEGAAVRLARRDARRGCGVLQPRLPRAPTISRVAACSTQHAARSTQHASPPLPLRANLLACWLHSSNDRLLCTAPTTSKAVVTVLSQSMMFTHGRCSDIKGTPWEHTMHSKNRVLLPSCYKQRQGGSTGRTRGGRSVARTGAAPRGGPRAVGLARGPRASRRARGCVGAHLASESAGCPSFSESPRRRARLQRYAGHRRRGWGNHGRPWTGRGCRGRWASACRVHRQLGRGVQRNWGQAAPAAGTGVSRAPQSAPRRHVGSASLQDVLAVGAWRICEPLRLYTGPGAAA